MGVGLAAAQSSAASAAVYQPVVKHGIRSLEIPHALLQQYWLEVEK